MTLTEQYCPLPDLTGSVEDILLDREHYFPATIADLYDPEKIMTAAEKLYQLLQTLPESQINEVLHFAESLQQKQLTTCQQAIPPGTLTGLRGIAKRSGPAPSNDEVQAEYTDYLTQKYE